MAETNVDARCFTFGYAYSLGRMLETCDTIMRVRLLINNSNFSFSISVLTPYYGTGVSRMKRQNRNDSYVGKRESPTVLTKEGKKHKARHFGLLLI